MSKTYFTKEDLPESVIEVRPALRSMTPKERFQEFVRGPLKRYFWVIPILIAAAVFFVFHFNPPADGTAVFVTSKFLPDDEFCEDIGEIVSLTFPDMNDDGANRGSFEAFYISEKPVYVTQTVAEQQRAALLKLLESGDKFLFVADEENARWLAENGYVEPALQQGQLPGVLVEGTVLVADSKGLLEFMDEPSAYRNLLAGYRLMLPTMPQREDYEDEELYMKHAKQYAAAYGAYQSLCSDGVPRPDPWALLYGVAQ